MQNRKICIDTETTGLYVEEGERVFEIGCVELINNIRTGKSLQYYLNPERPLSQKSIEISGIEDKFLQDKPKFSEIVDEFLEFIGEAALVAHNASFDTKFINNELKLIGKRPLKNKIIDSLQIARRKFPGQKASLDVLCKKYNIDNSKRVFHGALLDADLLVDVYVNLIGGMEGGLVENENSIEDTDINYRDNFANMLATIRSRKARQVRNFSVDDAEVRRHEDFVAGKIKNPLWLKSTEEQ
jgi:DNA polymerase-3 subunit epsilon